MEASVTDGKPLTIMQKKEYEYIDKIRVKGMKLAEKNAANYGWGFMNIQ